MPSRVDASREKGDAHLIHTFFNQTLPLPPGLVGDLLHRREEILQDAPRAEVDLGVGLYFRTGRISNGTLRLCPVALSLQPARPSSPASDYIAIETTSPAFDLGMASRIFGINGNRSISRFVFARRINTAILKRGRFC